MSKKKLRIKILQGVPCSGKSTWAKTFMIGRTDWIRINRDDLRSMCGDYWVPSREKLITNYEQQLVRLALQNNYNVLIDDTNLNPKTITTWESIAKEFDTEIEFKEFQISYFEAIRRDKERERSVGEKTIRIFFQKYYPEQLTQELNI